MASLKKHHADKGNAKDEGELRDELNKLKDKNYNRASWSHDSLVSLAGSTISRHYGAIPRDRDATKHAEVTSEDIKSAYKKSENIIKGAPYVRKFMENNDSSITSEVKDNIAKRNHHDYDSNADRFVKNINKKSKEDTKRRNKKITIDEKVNNGSYKMRDAGEELKDGIVNTLSDAFEKRNLIKSSLNSLFSVRPLSLVDKASGGRFSAMGRIHSGIRDVRDAKKSDARILAENHLINKKEITPEELYDKRWYKNSEALIKYFEDPGDHEGRIRKRVKKLLKSSFVVDGAISKSSNILTNFGFRSEYNSEEREKIEKIIDRVEKRGGAKELDRFAKYLVEHPNDDKCKDIFEKLHIPEATQTNIEGVKELLLGEDNDRDWRESFADTKVVNSDDSKGLVVDPTLEQK
jgi:hypothetical protein